MGLGGWGGRGEMGWWVWGIGEEEVKWVGGFGGLGEEEEIGRLGVEGGWWMDGIWKRSRRFG